MLKILLFVFTFSMLQESYENARILGVVPTPSYSHQEVFQPIWRELAKRGHEVVVITTDPENDPTSNVKEIDISFSYELWTKNFSVIKSMEKYKYNPFKLYDLVISSTTKMCDAQLLHPEVQAILKNETEHFDLVMAEALYTIMFGFAAKFKCPSIGIVSTDVPNMFHSIFGNPIHPAAYPDALLSYEGKLTFFERLASAFYNVLVNILFVMLHIPTRQTEIMQNHFGKTVPAYYDIINNISMIFINVDPATYVRPLGPAFIAYGGGVHLKPKKELPQDLQKYLDSAKNGAIYFSFGTNVKSDMIPPQLIKTMLETFKELPYKVLWKFDISNIADVPENVKIVNWVPQQDILRHPNVKLFITQGGLQSTEEAIFCNVPLIGIPFVGDQHKNINKIVRKGCGLYLDKSSLSKESLREAILEVINNPKYKQKTIEVAELSKDQPMTGLEKAVWWTEYVIRHKGAPHFRNPIVDLPFYQYYLLDVIGTVGAIILLFLFIIYKITVFIKNIIFRSNSNKKIKQQ